MNILEELRELADKYEREQRACLLGRVNRIGEGERIRFTDLSGDEGYVCGDAVSVRLGTTDGEDEGHFLLINEDQVISLIAVLERWVNTRSFR
jgi:hypothetical protein